MSEIEKLQHENSHLKDENIELKAKIEHYEQRIKLMMQKKYASKSEQVSDDQLSFFDDLFNEAETSANSKANEPEYEQIAYRRRKRSNDSVKVDLPIEEIHYTLDQDAQTCDICHHPLHEIGTSSRDEIEIIPAQVVLKRHITHKYGCRNCEKNHTKSNIRHAKTPTPLFKGSMASPSAVSEIIVQKYMNAVPLYRQQKYFETLGIHLSRQNMSNWLTKASNYLEIIYDELHKQLLRQDIIHADETPLQVLKEPGRKHSQKSYMWLYKSSKYENPIVLYDYRVSRSYDCPKSFLKGFSGYLQTDGYAAYGKLKNVTQVTCLAHIRRKFKEALDVISDPKAKKGSLANVGFVYCNKLYHIENEICDLPLDQRQQKRLAFSAPIFEEFESWIKAQIAGVLPKSIIGKAITYASNQLPKLKNYLKDPRIEIDNNSAERSIKPFVQGRKNWLFSNTPNGAKASAVIYSIVETAKQNNLKVFDYLCYLLKESKGVDHESHNVLHLLPWANELPDSIRK